MPSREVGHEHVSASSLFETVRFGAVPVGVITSERRFKTRREYVRVAFARGSDRARVLKRLSEVMTRAAWSAMKTKPYEKRKKRL
jgi:hypothetical protein